MATEKEIRIRSKAVLYDLLMIQHAIKTGKVEEVLEDIIDRAIGFMDSDDVASVKETVNIRFQSKNKNWRGGLISASPFL